MNCFAMMGDEQSATLGDELFATLGDELFATLGDELFATLGETSQSPAETKPHNLKTTNWTEQLRPEK